MSEIDASASLCWIKCDVDVKKNDAANKPSARSCHTLTVVGTNAFLFGGLVEHTILNIEDEADYAALPTNDVFLLKLSTNTNLEWTKLHLSNPKPLPRWRHSATVFNNTQIFIFGGYHSSDQRLNDVWIFDSVGRQWHQPNPEHNAEAQIPHQLTNIVWPNVPSPRAGHSATLVGDNIYIFGGYGGMGYSRRDLDDLYIFNTIHMTWSKVQAKGSAPDKRSGHQACAVEKKIYIFGGSNSAMQFTDLYTLDTEFDPPVWTKLSCSLTQPIWNHVACSVIAIPKWKIFCFGGISGHLSDNDRQGTMVNTTYILDTGIDRWSYPKIDGRPPPSRSDTCMAYDPKGSRLVVFGGWANKWLDDIYTLDVGNIVGPPYAIIDMSPNMGPVTGGTEVTIVGIDFINTTDVIVRFGSVRNYIDVPGTILSQSKIVCVSPDFTRFPPEAIEVRVALNGDSFTTTYQRFTFFSVTNAMKSIMYGPGILNGCAIMEDVSFVIQARDDQNQNRTTG
jgi:dynein heavy chain